MIGFNAGSLTMCMRVLLLLVALFLMWLQCLSWSIGYWPCEGPGKWGGLWPVGIWEGVTDHVGKLSFNCVEVGPFLMIMEYLHSRLNNSNEMQQYADNYLLLNYSTCFGRPPRPSSGVHKTVVAASGTDHTIWGASFLKHDQIRSIDRVLIWSRLRKLAPQIVWSVPEAATTVLCTPDDGRDGRQKHVI